MSIYIGPQNSVNQGKIVLKKIEDGLALDREHIEFTTRGLLLHVAHLESELSRLRNLIEDAPHDTYCSEFGPCDCWKLTALEGK